MLGPLQPWDGAIEEEFALLDTGGFLNRQYLNSKLNFHAPSLFLGSLPRKEEERSRYLLASG